MKIEHIAKILDLHSVPYFIEGGRIYADSMEAFAPTVKYIDMTDYTRSELYAWLGY